MTQVKIKKLDPRAQLPKRMTTGAAGADLYACMDENIVLKPLERAIVPTGLSVELPPGTELQVRPRSGLAAKNGISVVNTPGTVDEDYRGEIKVILINLGSEVFTVEHGMRIAQAVVTTYLPVTYTETTDLSDTVRGAGGHGSTGV